MYNKTLMLNNIQILPLQVLKPYTTVTDDQSIHFINTDTSIRPADIDFVKLPNGKYTSLDPRLYDSPRSQRLELNRPPLVSLQTQPQESLQNIQGNHVGFYKDYESIRGGNIKYYSDLLFSAPFGVINFSIPSYTVPLIMTDPMGSIKPYYERIPINNQNTSLYDYSFVRDTSGFREDIMATQRQRGLRSGWRPFEFFNNREKYYPMYKNDAIGQFPWTQK